MQAIVTKFICPSNSHGPRLKAACDAGSVTVPYPHELDAERAHAAAAMALARKLGWTPENGYMGDWVAGGVFNGGYCFVLSRSPSYPSSFWEGR